MSDPRRALAATAQAPHGPKATRAGPGPKARRSAAASRSQRERLRRRTRRRLRLRGGLPWAPPRRRPPATARGTASTMSGRSSSFRASAPARSSRWRAIRRPPGAPPRPARSGAGRIPRRKEPRASPAPGLPSHAGVSFKLERRDEVAKGAPYIGFIELHAENCMIRRPAASQARRIGGASSGLAARPRTLDRRRGAAGRGASGASARPDPARPPGERLAWSRHDGACFADLLPQPYDATLTWVTAHVERTQESSACGCCRRLRRPASGSGSRPSARPSS